MRGHENALAEAKSSLEQLKSDLAGKQAELEKLQVEHSQELEMLRQQIVRLKEPR